DTVSGVNRLVSRCPTQCIATTAPEGFFSRSHAISPIIAVVLRFFDIFANRLNQSFRAILTQSGGKNFHTEFHLYICDLQRRPIFQTLDLGNTGTVLIMAFFRYPLSKLCVSLSRRGSSAARQFT